MGVPSQYDSIKCFDKTDVLSSPDRVQTESDVRPNEIYGKITEGYYFPPAQLLQAHSKYDPAQQTLTLPKRVISKLLFDLFSAYGFNESDYRSRYDDVDKAIQNGEVKSGLHHFCSSGFFEGRIANMFTFDESYYLHRNPDVWKAVQRGDLTSAYDHFVSTGINEGRVPNNRMDVVLSEWLSALSG
jgi:hypothetical protein